MLDEVVAFVARHAGKERSVATRVLALATGFSGFFVAAPVLLGAIGHLIARFGGITVSRFVEIPLGVTGVLLGLTFLFWSVLTFWVVGKGTPVPFASPIRLVTSGPFRYTRNPIKLGAVLFYFGSGTICDGLVTGVVMCLLGVALGSLYHKLIEEKELLARFGQEYADYRRRTSFLLPRPPRGEPGG
jgi:protein-S-isoprenylcysteine O-methyltransferase Ste14